MPGTTHPAFAPLAELFERNLADGTDVGGSLAVVHDGELVAAEGGATYENINPADESVIGVAADASPADVRRAIAAARRAFDET